MCIPISDIDIDTDIDIDMDSGEGWPSIYLCTEGWQPISPFWEDLFIYRSSYLPRRRWPPLPTYLKGDGIQSTYLGNDSHLFTHVGEDGQLFIYFGGVYVPIDLPI